MKEIYKRRSIREYTEKNISNEILNKILKAGMNAPSARNIKPYEFIVIKDKNILKELSKSTPYSGMIENSNCTIVGISMEESPYWQFDLGLSMQNMMLEAIHHGIGTCCIGIREENEGYVKEKLNIPNNYKIIAMLPCGYPREEKEENNNFYEEKIHYEKYS